MTCGNSICSHMPGACGAPESHRAPGVAPVALPAPATLWLAVNVHSAAFVSAVGTVGNSSATVHGERRAPIVLRTSATCAGVTKPALLPKLLRTNDATSAIQASSLAAIGTITAPPLSPKRQHRRVDEVLTSGWAAPEWPHVCSVSTPIGNPFNGGNNMQNDDAISVLNNLIETCKDGELGFKTAAEGLKSASIKATFLEYSRQRAEMARTLQAEVRRLGGDPEKAGSVSGTLHRGWLDIKSAITGKDDHGIVAEAERGEDVAKAAYENALKETLPGTAHAVVQQQAAQVRQAHDAVRDLRDREKVSR
ncbi:MAG: PA2169 family four-helix-bundle protein [Acidobacteriota bacterium]